MIGRRGGGSTLTVGAHGADGLVHEPHRGIPPAFPSPLTRSADANLRESRPAPLCAQNTRLQAGSGLRCVENFAAKGAIPCEVKDPQLAADIRAVVEPHTQADPELKS